MEQASRQILRAIRGKRAQKAFARRLGYRANPITDWECGRRFPTANETLRAAARTGIDVPAAFNRFAPQTSLQHDGQRWLLHAWMRQVTGDTSVTELGRRMGRSRSSLSRWLSGVTFPRLPEFLEFVDAVTGRVHDLVAELVSIEQVPSLRGRYEAARAARLMAFEQPWTEAILRALETPSYLRAEEHDAKQIAELLGVPPPLVSDSIELLHRAGIVEWKDDKYQVAGVLSVDTRGGKQALHALKHHWAKVAAERALVPRAGDLFGYNVISASTEDVERIRQLLQTTFHEIRGIVASSGDCEQVALVNLQLVRWG